MKAFDLRSVVPAEQRAKVFYGIFEDATQLAMPEL